MTYTNWDMVKTLARYVKPYKRRFFIGTFCRASSDLLWLFVPWAMGEIVTFAAEYTRGESLEYFWKIIIMLFAFALYHWVAHETAKYLIFTLAERVSFDAQIKTIKHLFRLDTLWHEREASGNKLKRIGRGGESLNNILRLYVHFVVESSINIVGISIVFFTVSRALNIFFVTFFVTYFILSYFLSRWGANQANKVNVKEEEFEGYKFEAVNNIATVKSLGIGEKIAKFIEGITKQAMDAIRVRVFRFRARGFVLGLYEELFRLGVVLYTTLNVFNGNFKVGTIALVLLYFNKIEEASSELAETAHEFVVSKIALMRMEEILREKPTVELSGTKPFDPDWKQLSLKNVRFSYKGREVLRGITLAIARGEKIGIVGISGAGKSTLFKLLLKLYEDYEGEICFDALPLRAIKRSSYLNHITVVPQETELFNLSLKDNIVITGGDAISNEERLNRAVTISHVKDFLHKLDKGIDTRIGEKGVRLSGGERQRVGIARAVYRKPDILLLDEATSHLDTASERTIQDALHEFLKDVTAIIIAHRLSTLKEVNRIVVIKQGKIHEEGTFGELLEKRGEFWKLWQKQKF